MTFFWPTVAALGAGGAAYFLFTPAALATEDSSGDRVAPEVALPPALLLPASGAPQSIGLRAVDVLSRYVGVAKGDPNGSHRSKAVDEIVTGVRGDGKSLLGKPWCALAVKFGFEKAAAEPGLPPPFAAIKSKLAAVTDWRDQFKAYRATDPKPGMPALILSGGIRHATLVSRVDGDDLYTVEGNHGDAMAFVKRPKSRFDVFVDVDAYVRDRAAPRVVGANFDPYVWSRAGAIARIGVRTADYALGCDVIGCGGLL